MTIPNNHIIDLTDITFLIPVRIDSDQRNNNLSILLNLLNRDFETNVIVLEADKKQLYVPPKEIKNLKYFFIHDEDEIFYRTRYINQMIAMSSTPYIAVWDTDAIAAPGQIADAVTALRNQVAVMAFPFDGRFYEVSGTLYNLFCITLKFEALLNNLNLMPLRYGYNMVGGAFMVNREKYITAGMENEIFYGWGDEDNERVKRMEVLGLPIYRAQGPLFHLWHQRGQNSWFANRETEIRNKREFLKTCSRKMVNF
jgi:GT2 family glycosyltransferase